MNKTCLECQDKIVGREDKKFCSDGCRNAYNNKINKDQTNLMRNINNKLRKNYRILTELNPEEKTKTTKNKLISKGFDFDLITSIYTTKTGNIYYFVYDQGYLAVENENYTNAKGEKVEQTEWHRISAWGKTAEIVEKLITKGCYVAIEGKLTHRIYDDKDGNKRFITEVVVNELVLLSK